MAQRPGKMPTNIGSPAYLFVECLEGNRRPSSHLRRILDGTGRASIASTEKYLHTLPTADETGAGRTVKDPQ
jgi:hypothetical protein